MSLANRLCPPRTQAPRPPGLSLLPPRFRLPPRLSFLSLPLPRTRRSRPRFRTSLRLLRPSPLLSPLLCRPLQVPLQIPLPRLPLRHHDRPHLLLPRRPPPRLLRPRRNRSPPLRPSPKRLRHHPRIKNHRMALPHLHQQRVPPAARASATTAVAARRTMARSRRMLSPVSRPPQAPAALGHRRRV